MSDQAKTAQIISQIARQHLRIETLQVRHSDRLDFHDCGVASEMPTDEVWQRQAKMLLEQRAASLLSALNDVEIRAVASGQISMQELWAQA